MTKDSNKKQSFAMEIIQDLKAQNNRLFIINIILCIALLLSLIF